MCLAASSPPTRPFSDDRVSLGFPLFPLDPRDQLGTPLLPVERLDAMGRRALEHQVVGGAATPQPESARGPHVVELGLSETLVEDPRPGERQRSRWTPCWRHVPTARRPADSRRGQRRDQAGSVSAQPATAVDDSCGEGWSRHSDLTEAAVWPDGQVKARPRRRGDRQAPAQLRPVGRQGHHRGRDGAPRGKSRVGRSSHR